MVDVEIDDAKKYTSFTGRFDGCADAPVLCGAHCLMEEVKGFARSHWTPPPGKYLLQIAPAGTRATANKATMKKCTNLTAHFYGHGGAPV
jgi:hypothetical protein